MQSFYLHFYWFYVILKNILFWSFITSKIVELLPRLLNTENKIFREVKTIVSLSSNLLLVKIEIRFAASVDFYNQFWMSRLAYLTFNQLYFDRNIPLRNFRIIRIELKNSLKFYQYYNELLLISSIIFIKFLHFDWLKWTFHRVDTQNPLTRQISCRIDFVYSAEKSRRIND